MNRDQLAQGMRLLGCTPREIKGTGYPVGLLRCDCGQRHALAAAAAGPHEDGPVKLFGAALSWYAASGRTEPLTFVLGKDERRQWERSLHAIQMILPKSVPVDLRVDFEPAPALCDEDLSLEGWIQDLLNVERRTVPPYGCQLADAAAIESFAWYRPVSNSPWSGRLDGLQVCTLHPKSGRLTFNVGAAGRQGKEAKCRSEFRRIAVAHAELFGDLNSKGEIQVDLPMNQARAVAILQVLAAKKIALQGSAEHCLESRILRGATAVATKDGVPLVPVGNRCQFPARWWPGGHPRYIDVLARQGAAPWVVELKTERSQGEYYRNGIVQAALYREYILRSPRLDRWFEPQGLERKACRAALVIPTLRGDSAEALRRDHRRVADALGVELIEVTTPQS